MPQNKEELKNKILYRASYRGTKEMDIMMTKFVKSIINDLNIDDLKELDLLVNQDDETLISLKKGLVNLNLKKKIVSKNGIDTPNWLKSQKLPKEDQLDHIGLPMVVKPNDQGSTIGLSMVRDRKKLIDAYNSASEFADSIIFESFINGREITIPIIGDIAFPIVEIIPNNDLYDYECKYTSGMSEYFCPADIDEESTKNIKKIALKIHRLLKCRHYSRVDFLLDSKNKLWFLEINTLPGMTETSLLPKSLDAAGYNFTDVIQMIIDEAIKNK